MNVTARSVATLVIMRDGRPNGSLITINLPDGTVLGPGDTPKLLPLGAAATKWFRRLAFGRIEC